MIQPSDGERDPDWREDPGEDGSRRDAASDSALGVLLGRSTLDVVVEKGTPRGAPSAAPGVELTAKRVREAAEEALRALDPTVETGCGIRALPAHTDVRPSVPPEVDRYDRAIEEFLRRAAGAGIDLAPHDDVMQRQLAERRADGGSPSTSTTMSSRTRSQGPPQSGCAGPTPTRTA